MVRYDTYCDTGITIWYVSRYIYYPLIYEMQNCVIEVPIRIYYNIWGNTYHDIIFSLAMCIVGAVYRYIVIHWWIVTSLVIRNYVLLLVVPPLCLWWVTHIVTKALRLKILPGQQLLLFPNPPTLLTCHLTGKPGEPCRPALPPAAPSTRDSPTSTSHRGRSDAQKLPTPGRPAGLTSQPNGHTTWW